MYKVRKTVLQLLKDRGYMVADAEVEMSRTQFTEKYGDNMKRADLMFTKTKRDGSDQVFL